MNGVEVIITCGVVLLGVLFVFLSYRKNDTGKESDSTIKRINASDHISYDPVRESALDNASPHRNDVARHSVSSESGFFDERANSITTLAVLLLSMVAVALGLKVTADMVLNVQSDRVMTIFKESDLAEKESYEFREGSRLLEGVYHQSKTLYTEMIKSLSKAMLFSSLLFILVSGCVSLYVRRSEKSSKQRLVLFVLCAVVGVLGYVYLSVSITEPPYLGLVQAPLARMALSIPLITWTVCVVLLLSSFIPARNSK